MLYYCIISTPFLFYFLKLLLTNFIIPQHKRKAIYQQMQREIDWPSIAKTEHFLKNLFKGVSGKSISKLYRFLHLIKNKEFVYGEIDFLSFYGILKTAQPKAGEIFYDLGSGTGKAVFCAALFFPFTQAKGIELLAPLHQKALFFLKKAENFSDNSSYGTKIHAIEFLNANFLKHDFSAADIVYIAATCLNAETWEKLINKLAQLKPGSRVIVATKSITHPYFQLLYQGIEIMSWGLCPVRIYKVGHVTKN